LKGGFGFVRFGLDSGTLVVMPARGLSHADSARRGTVVAVGISGSRQIVDPNPCLTCGACCAFFRASFYWAEGNDAKPDGVPVELTEKLTPFLRVMKGTNSATPRCIALHGNIGEAVLCTIHTVRSSVCRDFAPSYEDGVTPNERCDKARARWGLPALTPEDWKPITPDADPEDTPPMPEPIPA
jgi:Fe-S-cluster containining protein